MTGVLPGSVVASHNLAPECEELLKVLADGEWWDYEKMMETVGNRIPPGRALRKSEERLESQAKKVGPRKRPPPTDEQKIRSGRRSLVTSAVHSMQVRYLEFELDELGRRARVRRRKETLLSKTQGFRLPAAERRALEEALGGPVEQCVTCGCWIAAGDVHDAFHEQRWGRSGRLMDVEDLKEVLRPMLVAELRGLGLGLRHWMKENFGGYGEDSAEAEKVARERGY